MKLRIVDRLLAALVGLVLVVLAAIPLADTLFGLQIFDRLAQLTKVHSRLHLLVLVGGGAFLLIAGVLCLLLAVRRPKKHGFVMQATDAGELSISMRALEALVSKCVEKHDEMHITSTSLENTRNGLVIVLRVSMATGMNIPLAVSALQKQIRQYVTACSGVDVYEVRVQVDTATGAATTSAYTVSGILESVPPLSLEETKTLEAPPQAEPKAAEAKCLHQRLFSEEEQPAVVPAPPEGKNVEAQEASQEEAAGEEITEDAETTDEYVVDEETIAELEALDGAEGADVETEEAEIPEADGAKQ